MSSSGAVRGGGTVEKFSELGPPRGLNGAQSSSGLKTKVIRGEKGCGFLCKQLSNKRLRAIDETVQIRSATTLRRTFSVS